MITCLVYNCGCCTLHPLSRGGVSLYCYTRKERMIFALQVLVEACIGVEALQVSSRVLSLPVSS
jgi:hypothetical protein